MSDGGGGGTESELKAGKVFLEKPDFFLPLRAAEAAAGRGRMRSKWRGPVVSAYFGLCEKAALNLLQITSISYSDEKLEESQWVKCKSQGIYCASYLGWKKVVPKSRGGP